MLTLSVFTFLIENRTAKHRKVLGKKQENMVECYIFKMKVTKVP